jgi:hypothetical protein
VVRSDAQRESRLPDASGPDEGDQAVLVDQRRQFPDLLLPADEAGERRRQDGVGARCPAQLGAQAGQRRPVRDAELAHQRGDMALHRPHRQVQPFGDLAVAEPLGDGRQHLGLTLGDTGPSQSLGHVALGAGHADIVRRRGCSRGPPAGIRSEIRSEIGGSHG